MSDLEPITRNEHFLNGDDLEPITREEHILAGEDLTPVTRHEWFLKKYRGGGSSVTVEALTVTDNGTYSEEGKAYSPVTVNVDKGLEIVDLDKSDIVSFADGLALPITSGKFYINAQQDLNGYDKPWAGGGGKNKLRLDSFSAITSNDVTFTYDNGVINANGTASHDFIFVLPLIGVTTNYTTIDNIVDGITADTDYTLTGCVGGTPQTYWMQILISGSGSEPANYNNPVTFSFTAEQIASQQRQIAIRIKNGTQMNNVKFYPMIRLASVADDTYEPYSNICPITGFSSMDVVVTPTESASDGTTYSTTFSDTVYGGYYDSVNGKIINTHGNIASYNGESLPGAWLSSMDEYVEGTTPTTGAQVVYELTTPTETDAPTTCISTIEGTNNIYHNCNGETEVSVLKEA